MLDLPHVRKRTEKKGRSQHLAGDVAPNMGEQSVMSQRADFENFLKSGPSQNSRGKAVKDVLLSSHLWLSW